MTKWQIVLDEKLDKLLRSTKVLKSSVQMLHQDFNHLDEFIDSLDVNVEYKQDNQEAVIPTLILPYLEGWRKFYPNRDLPHRNLPFLVL